MGVITFLRGSLPMKGNGAPWSDQQLKDDTLPVTCH